MAMAEIGFVVNALSPVLGAEIIGLDLSKSITESDFNALRQSWVDHNGVLVIRDQRITPEQHILFSQKFGQLEKHVVGEFLLEGYPEIYRVSTKVGEDGKPMGNPESGRYWHSDLSYLEKPSMASLLYALEIPNVGGDTMLSCMYAAYEALSSKMKKFLGGMLAVHDFRYVRRNFSESSPVAATNSKSSMPPPVKHPVIRTHPESGRKALFVNPGFTTHIVGLEKDESRSILDFLFAHSTRPEFIYRHKWQLNDVLFWDNRCTMHHAVHDFNSTGCRHMHRTTVLGDQATH